MEMKTTTRGAEIIELIRFLIDDRNGLFDRLNSLNDREMRVGLTMVEEHNRARLVRQIEHNDGVVGVLRGALDREHASMAEALGVW